MRDDDDKTLPAGDADPDATLQDSPHAALAHISLEASQVIGNYRLVRRIGEGGMGEVWEAEQERPVRRQVALKLIKAGMDTRQVVARFEAERQALALMDHPYIAKVFDAGATEQGRPYFVMEFASGVPITKYCDEQQMDTHDRLRLFIRVCEGVQHAHQKAIIHRDIKPSNVLASEQDGTHVPKIIDFGVAKAISDKLTDRTMYTQVGALIGTLEYMSPEQVSMSGEDIDTRTDVYALGVLLYQLLVGKLPFDTRELRQTGLDEIRRIIVEDDPERPSTRISTLGESSGPSAELRRTDRRSLVRLLRGELDWITGKALEKDRSRRYSTPGELAADIQRYLDLEPVLAGPPSRTYRMRKFARKHRTSVAAGGLVALALVLGTIGSTVGLLRAVRAEAEAKREAEKTEAVNQILHDMLSAVRPEQAQGQEVTVRELLDEASKQIELGVRDAEVEAEVRNTIGSTYEALGLYDAAEAHLRTALDTRRARLGEDHPEVGESLHSLGRLMWAKSDFPAAETHLRKALALNRRQLGDKNPSVLAGLNDLGVVLQSQGDYEGAESMFREALDLRRELYGDDDPAIADNLSNLAWVLIYRGQVDEAEQLFREALDTSREQLGGEHPNVTSHMTNLASMLQMLGKSEEAEVRGREALAKRRTGLGAEHPSTLRGLQGLGEMYLGLGRPDDAEPLLSEALATAERTLGSDHTLTITLLADVGWVHRARGDFAAAEPYYREVLSRRQRALGPEHPHTLRVMWQVSRLQVDQGKYAEGEKIARDALGAGREVFPPGNENLCSILLYLGLALEGQGEAIEAEPFLRECFDARLGTLPAGSWETAHARSALGAALAGQSRFAEAEEHLLGSLEQLEAGGAPPLRVRQALDRIVDLYERWNATDPAAGKSQALSRWRAEAEHL